jgi:hypothetical protein
MNQLLEAEREVIEKLKTVTERFTEKSLNMNEMLEIQKEQNETTKYVESIISAIEETKQKEEVFLKELEEKYGKKYTVTDLIEIINEND